MTARAREMASIIKCQGQRGFSITPEQEEQNVMSAHLCGMTVYFTDELIVRLSAPDVDVVITPVDDPADKPLADRYQGGDFQKGGMPQLEEWHSRLNHLQTVFVGDEAAL